MNAIRSEWIKLSTLAVVKVLLGLAVAFPIVITVFTTVVADGPFTSDDLADLIGGLTVLSSLLFGVVAAIGITNEFNYNTIRPTFAAQPRRLRPLLAKLTVHVLVSSVLVAFILASSWVLGSAIADDGGARVFVEQSQPVTEAIFGSGLLAIGLTILGFGLGLLIRNTPATVSFLLLWPLLGESIVRGIFSALDRDDWGKYLPYFEGLSLGFVDRGNGDTMTRLNAGLYFFAWVIAVAAIGLFRTEKSDA